MRRLLDALSFGHDPFACRIWLGCLVAIVVALVVLAVIA